MSFTKEIKRKTTQNIREMKAKGEKIAMLTGYDYTMASILDGAGIDIILVGDSAANVMAGYDTTLPITLDQMIYHASAVVRASRQAMVVVDMPFGTYQGDSNDALKGAVQIMKQTGAHALKLEGGKSLAPTIKRIVDAGIPVMGHLGLTPQSIHQFGSFGLRAKEEAEAEKLMQDALVIQEAGCFGLVLEKIPAALAGKVTGQLHIPTIGIGAGSSCDGQVLVMHDLLGLNKDFHPKFVRKYLDLHTLIGEATSRYIMDVKSGDFPNPGEQY